MYRNIISPGTNWIGHASQTVDMIVCIYMQICIWAYSQKKSKWVWSGNTTIIHCRPTEGTVRKSHRIITITSHEEDKQRKTINWASGLSNQWRISFSFPGKYYSSTCICYMWCFHILATHMSDRDNIKSLSKQNKSKSATRGAQLVPIGIPTICLYNFEPNLINILSKR